MASGALPFHGNSTAEICEAIMNRAPVAPVRLNPDLPAELERIINRALEKDRELRYQGAREMKAGLLRLKRDTETGRVTAAGSGTGVRESHPVTAASQKTDLQILMCRKRCRYLVWPHAEIGVPADCSGIE
jgi:hypothetical protein